MVMGNEGICGENKWEQEYSASFRINKIFQWEVYLLLCWIMFM